MGVFKVFIYNWALLGSSWHSVHFTSTKSRTTLMQTFGQKCMWDENKETVLKSQKSTAKRSTESSVTHPQHNAWYGLVTHMSLGKRDMRRTRSKRTHKTQSRTMGRHGYLRHVKCAPGWWGHVTNTMPAQSIRWIKRKKRKEKKNAEPEGDLSGTVNEPVLPEYPKDMLEMGLR